MTIYNYGNGSPVNPFEWSANVPISCTIYPDGNGNCPVGCTSPAGEHNYYGVNGPVIITYDWDIGYQADSEDREMAVLAVTSGG